MDGASFVMFRHLIAKAQEIHVCVNNCMVFYGNEEWRSWCKVCGEPRYKQNSKSPLNKFYYFSLTDRIKRLFENPDMAKLVHYPQERNVDPDVISDVMDSDLWRNVFDEHFGDGVGRDLAFSMCLDGVQTSNRSARQMYAVAL